jgi:sortase (surface protein transpeptidase)
VRPITTHRAAIDVLTARPVIAPVRVSIPALDVEGPVLPAGVNDENELDVPPDAGTLVWYRHGPSPGERGSAVIAGHLNWRGASGLFADLAATPIGAEITVGYEDGSARSFVVQSVELVPKPAVSVNGVFARGGARVLRLVTCGGEFDDAVRSYRSNVVVTAVPA